MELRQIEYFMAVSRVKNFTQAAKELYLSQPAITSAINNLERELGVKLFHRTKRFVELTDEGQTFLAHASIVVAEIEETISRMEKLREKKKGRLRIAINPLVASIFLPPFSNSLLAQNVTFIICEDMVADSYLKKGDCDAAILFDRTNTCDKNINKICLLESKIACYTSDPFDESEIQNTTIIMGAPYSEHSKSIQRLLKLDYSGVIIHSEQIDVIKNIQSIPNTKIYLPDFCQNKGTIVYPSIDCDIYLLTRDNLDICDYNFIQSLKKIISEGSVTI